MVKTSQHDGVGSSQPHIPKRRKVVLPPCVISPRNRLLMDLPTTNVTFVGLFLPGTKTTGSSLSTQSSTVPVQSARVTAMHAQSSTVPVQSARVTAMHAQSSAISGQSARVTAMSAQSAITIKWSSSGNGTVKANII